MSSLRGHLAAIIANRLRYVHPDGTLLFGNLTFRAPLARYGLIGPNGIGKTTLLRLIAAELEPSGGELRVVGSTAYLPQRDDASAAQSRSGGERMRVRLAELVACKPTWLLLDEPTNHLDAESRAALYATLDGWRGGAVVASHDRELLERVDRIFELSSLGMRSYGGAYGLYLERRKFEETAAEATIRLAQSRLDHERRDRLLALERTQRATEHAKKRAKRQNIPKVARGAMQRKAQVTAAKSADTHGDRVCQAEDRLQAARASRREERAIAIDLPETSVPAKKRVVRCAGLNVTFFDGRRLWAREVDLELMGPRRIAIGGRNGSGKTSLLRILAGEPSACARIDGSVDVGVRAVYLDQHVAFLRDDLSLVEAMRDAAPQLREHERRIRLGRLLFEQERGLQPIGHLSGGERVRAALALLLYQPQPPQLLLLDEPTNNLDIRSAEHLTEVLLSYRGAIVAVSHDRQFLEGIGIERELNLDGFG
jgi:ATPase subunit of ABC transporter with duplicated ATPase domains